MQKIPRSSFYDSNRFLSIVFFGFLIVWFYMLGGRALVPTDEGRYAEMAREMLATGDWITLRLNGIKYFEKPPLQNWMNALTFYVFGLGEWQARLWNGVCGLLGILATAYTGYSLFGRRVAINAALILGSTFYWNGLAHINTLDMGVSCMMTLSLCGLLLAQQEGVSAVEQRNGMLLCWGGMALATLSKGPIGVVLPGAVLVLYSLWNQDWKLWTRLHFGKGLFVFFLITAPWFVLVWLKNPEHPHFFFIHEQFERYTSTVHKRGGPWYYFLSILFIGIFPWAGVLFHGVMAGFAKGVRGFKSKQLLLIWAGFIFVFFSFSGSKLPSYLLPIFPALALLIACELDRVSTRVLMGLSMSIVLIGCLGMWVATKLKDWTSDPFEIPFYMAAQPWVWAAGTLAFVAGIVALLCAKRQRDWAVIALAFGAFLGEQALFIGFDHWGRYSAGLIHVPAINAVLKPDTMIFSVGRYEQSLPFYLRRTVILVEHADEMEFGLQQQPELWIARREDFIAKWRAITGTPSATGIAIMRPEIYEEMLKINLPMQVIGRDPKRVIVTSVCENCEAKPLTANQN